MLSLAKHLFLLPFQSAAPVIPTRPSPVIPAEVEESRGFAGSPLSRMGLRNQHLGFLDKLEMTMC
jgi:hypothetical protein